MAHQTEIVVNGTVTEVTEFDHTAQEIDDGIDNLHTLTGGATTPQGALANLGAGVRPNLLDNGDFRAGHVVNQRGQTEYTASGYTIDRWKKLNSNGKITVNDGYLTLIGTGTYGYINQPMEGEIAPSYPVTLSILTKDGKLYSETLTSNVAGIYIGTFYFYVDKWLFTIRTPDDTTSIDIKAFKYEKGGTQTLAYQDEDGTWQLLPQPESDYATQLAKCQRYLLMGPINAPVWCLGYAFLPTPVTIRANPAIIGKPVINSVESNTAHPAAIATVNGIVNNGVLFSLQNVTETCYLHFPAGSGISCEL